MKSFIYPIVRITVGLILLIHSSITILSLNDYVENVHLYFDNASIFNFEFLKYLAFAIPFFEFLAGIFIMAGLLLKHISLIAYFLFFGIAAFLVDAGEMNNALFHIILASVLFLIHIKVDMNFFSVDSLRKG